MREGLESQFMFSGIPPEVLKTLIDALLADEVFVAATRTVAERITEIALRFTPKDVSGG